VGGRIKFSFAIPARAHALWDLLSPSTPESLVCPGRAFFGGQTPKSSRPLLCRALRPRKFSLVTFSSKEKDTADSKHPCIRRWYVVIGEPSDLSAPMDICRRGWPGKESSRTAQGGRPRRSFVCKGRVEAKNFVTKSTHSPPQFLKWEKLTCSPQTDPICILDLDLCRS
jgi:hypothetical protein